MGENYQLTHLLHAVDGVGDISLDVASSHHLLYILSDDLSFI